MKYAMFAMVVVLGSLFSAESQASGNGGLAPLQARRVANQNVRLAARNGRAQAVQSPCANGQCVQAVRVAPVIVQSHSVQQFRVVQAPQQIIVRQTIVY